jgi:1-deoxy-D-xylulose-5-phosphate synthase
VGEPVPAVRRHGSLDVLHETDQTGCDLLVVGVGAFATLAVDVAGKLEAQGRRVTAVDPRWVLPVSPDVVDLARSAGAVAVIEDNLASGGIGSAVTLALREAGIEVPVHQHGIPKRFLDHASRGQVLEQIGLTADSVATSLSAQLG